MTDLTANVQDPQRFYSTGATTIFAALSDQRLSYCLYVPSAHEQAGQALPLVVIVHGTARTATAYRDAFAEFAESHGCVVLAPLFPAGLIDPNDLHNFKFLKFHDMRFDLALLDIVAEIGQRYRVRTDRFLLYGFSGGGQFAHRFLYLHPERLAGASIGAPGRVTLLDFDQPWWLGVRDVQELFAVQVDLDALRRVPVHMVIGEHDVETWEINNVGGSNWMAGAEAAGRTRLERLDALKGSLERAGITVQLDVVADAGHDGLLMVPTVQRFFADVLNRRATPGLPGAGRAPR